LNNKINHENYKILVLDNNSEDDNLKILKDSLIDTRIIKLKKNYGFGGGMNKGIDYALEKNAEYILLLNNDVIVSKNFLTKLLKSLKRSKASAASPLIYQFPQKNKIWFYKGKRNWIKGVGRNIDYNALKNNRNLKLDLYTDFLSGCCLLLDVKSLNDNNVLKFDEKYFLYYEDDDYSSKILDKNLKLVFSSRSIIYHKVSASTGKDNPLLIYYLTRNRLLFMKNNYPKISYLILFILFFTFTRIIRLAEWGIKGDFDKIKMFFKGLFDFKNNNFGSYNK